ncbi:MAG: hypothetical protein U9R15_03125 [Chloroflexota bacterium]|nr:hypothetical protein [Chloroflexota bacterium]
MVQARFVIRPPVSISALTVVCHGRRDTVVPLKPVRAWCERLFTNLTFHAVDDDHRLREMAQAIDWSSLPSIPQ